MPDRYPGSEKLHERVLNTILQGTHNLGYAHGAADLGRPMEVHGEVPPILRMAVDDRKMAALLRCMRRVPHSKVR